MNLSSIKSQNRYCLPLINELVVHGRQRVPAKKPQIDKLNLGVWCFLQLQPWLEKLLEKQALALTSSDLAFQFCDFSEEKKMLERAGSNEKKE